MKTTFICMILTIVLAAFSAHAQWQENGVPVSVVTGDERDAEIISDGAGGSIIVWQTYYSYRDSPDVYAQRLDGDGYLLWPAGGVPVCTAPEGQYKPQIVSDGAGGAIIAWTDFRNGNADIYIQRIDPDGDPVWEIDGIAVCTALNTFPWSTYSRISMVERPGGAILAWYDDRSGENNIYAQRIDLSGVLLWTPGGIAVCTETGGQAYVLAVPDEAGGTIVLWIDWRSGERDLYAQCIAADSTLLWTPGGVPVCTAAGDQRKHDAIPDGSGGMICVWEDQRGSDIDLYSQMIRGDGLPAWTQDGIPVCVETNDQFDPHLSTDDHGGAFYTWADRRDALWFEHAIYAQHISTEGDSLWVADGILLRESGTNWDNCIPEIAQDCFGGAIISWFTGEPLPGSLPTTPSTSTAEDIEAIFVQRVAGDGTVWWQEGGVALCDHPGYTAPRGQRMLPDGTGGAVVAWYNIFALAGIYAQRVNGQGNTPPTGTGQNPPLPLYARNYPNPFNPSTTIAFVIPDAGHVDLQIYDIAGRLVRVLLSEQREAGSHEVVWDGTDDSGSIVASGVYFYNLAGNNQMRTRKMVLLR
jgi:predicted lipoprotein with Yx(FWY)xxD motif